LIEVKADRRLKDNSASSAQKVVRMHNQKMLYVLAGAAAFAGWNVLADGVSGHLEG
jgi:hypothetical protein